MKRSYTSYQLSLDIKILLAPSKVIQLKETVRPCSFQPFIIKITIIIKVHFLIVWEMLSGEGSHNNEIVTSQIAHMGRSGT